MNSINSNSLSKVLYACFSITILTIALSTLINSGLLLFNFKISGFSIIVAHVISILILVFNKEFKKLELLIATFTFYCLIIISYNLSVNTYDVSWDGQWYHQDAILKLYSGWNPMHSATLTNYSVIDSEMWIQHYPQASWYLQASMLELTEKIQSTKLINITLIFSVLFLSYYTISKTINIKSKAVKFLFSLVIAINPVVCYQINTFYVDGQSAMLLTNYILLLVLLYQKQSNFLYLLLACIFIYTCNIKFTNLVYISIFSFVFYVLNLIKNKKLNYKLSLYFVVLYSVTIFYVGYGSYGRNIIEKAHPFFPLMGANNYGSVVSDVNKSANFFDNNRVENWLLSNFAYPKYSRKPANSEFRIPFSKTEYFQYSRPDSELAGFGAIYSDILIVLLLVVLIPCIYFIKNFKRYYALFILILMVLLSILINSEMFVARYIPQFWLIPIVLLIGAYIYKNTIIQSTVILLLAALIINSYFIFERQYQHQKEVNTVIYQEIEYLKTLKQPIQIRNRYLSLERRLKENNISYINNRDNPNTERKEFVYTYYENYYFDK